MDLTTEDMKNYMQLISMRLRDPDFRRKLDRAEKEQDEREKMMAKNTDPICPREIVRRVSGSISKINNDKVGKLATERYYERNATKVLGCVASSFFFPSPDSPAIVRSWITKINQIGAESVEGYAFSARVGSDGNPFVIKVPRSKENSLLHEYIIGAYGLNKLRKISYNFAYIYGLFKCSPPLVKDKEALTWCNSTNPTEYIVYESVFPSKSMADFSLNATAQEWLEVYMQVLYSIRLASIEVGFTHYDLHDDNVLVRPLGEKKSVKYYGPDGETYIYTSNLPVIIDYGFARINLDKGYVGRYGLETNGVMPSMSRPLHDAYKLLMFSALRMYRAGNSEGIMAAATVYRFFNQTATLQESLLNQRKYYYFMPRKQTMPSIDDLIYFVMNSFNTNSFLGSSRGNELSCGNGCQDFNTILKSLFVGGVSNIVTFYESHKRAKWFKDKELMKQIENNFDFIEASTPAQADFIKMHKDLMTFPYKAPKNLRGRTAEQLMGIISDYRSYVEKVIKFGDIYRVYTRTGRAIIYASKIYGNEIAVDYVRRKVEELKQNAGNPNDYMKSLRDDYRYVMSLGDPRLRSGMYNFYTAGLSEILSNVTPINTNL